MLTPELFSNIFYFIPKELVTTLFLLYIISHAWFYCFTIVFFVLCSSSLTVCRWFVIIWQRIQPEMEYTQFLVMFSSVESSLRLSCFWISSWCMDHWSSKSFPISPWKCETDCGSFHILLLDLLFLPAKADVILINRFDTDHLWLVCAGTSDFCTMLHQMIPLSYLWW